MRVYSGEGGSSITVCDDDRVFIEHQFLSQNHEFTVADIIRVNFKKPRRFINGCLSIEVSQSQHPHDIVFNKKNADAFGELYIFLREKAKEFAHLHQEFFDTLDGEQEFRRGEPPVSAAPLSVSIASGNPDVDIAIEESLMSLSELENLRDEIKNKRIRDCAAEIIATSHKVIDKLKKHPELFSSAARFFSYYLPATMKLVTNYAYIEAQELTGERIVSTMQRIENTLETLQTAYIQKLDNLFARTALDLETDIDVIEQMLAQDGLAQNSSFKQRRKEI